MVTTRPPKTIVKPTAFGPVANTDTKLLIYGLFQKGRVVAQDGSGGSTPRASRTPWDGADVPEGGVAQMLIDAAVELSLPRIRSAGGDHRRCDRERHLRQKTHSAFTP